jgi:hypothetical protein
MAAWVFEERRVDSATREQAQLNNRERALALARAGFRAARAPDMAQRAGASYHPRDAVSGSLALRCLNLDLRVAYPEGVVEAEGDAPAPGYTLGMLVLHYLVHADGHPMADRWASYRELPDGLMYDRAFRGRVDPALLRTFGDDPEHFLPAARALGGCPIALGDAAAMFTVFPRVRMAFIFYRGDDEFTPAVNVLFDAAACHYLAIDDLAVLGGWLVGALIKTAGTH